MTGISQLWVGEPSGRVEVMSLDSSRGEIGGVKNSHSEGSGVDRTAERSSPGEQEKGTGSVWVLASCVVAEADICRRKEDGGSPLGVVLRGEPRDGMVTSGVEAACVNNRGEQRKEEGEWEREEEEEENRSTANIEGVDTEVEFDANVVFSGFSQGGEEGQIDEAEL